MKLSEMADYSQDKKGFVALFNRRGMLFAADRQSDARYIAGEQAAAWDRLLGLIETAMPREDQESIRVFGRAIRQGVTPKIQPSIVQQPSSGWKIESTVPIIHPQEIESLNKVIAQEPWFCLATVNLALIDIINVRSIARQMGANDPTGILADPRIIASYIEILRMIGEQDDPAQSALQIVQNSQKHIEAETKRAAGLGNRYAEHTARAKEDWQQYLTECRAEITLLKDQVADSIRLEATTNLWRDRTTAHLWWMVGSFIAMVVGIGVVITLVLTLALPELEPGLFEIITRSAYPTQKLVLITLCVIGAAWLLRFVARSIVENMALRADAQHRQSMLDTYLALRGEVGLKDEERTIILTALFRPLPGQAADENPPTVAGEALQKLLQR